METAKGLTDLPLQQTRDIVPHFTAWVVLTNRLLVRRFLRPGIGEDKRGMSKLLTHRWRANSLTYQNSITWAGSTGSIPSAFQ